MLLRSLCLFYCIVLFQISFAQKIGNYSFDNYPVAAVYTGPKAKLNFSNNPDAANYRTRISEEYKTGTISFAGAYVPVFWGCGMGCLTGAIVDARTGKIYFLPMGEESTYNGCTNNNEDNMHYKINSRMFVTVSCTGELSSDETREKQTRTYFVNIWDEGKKKFVESTVKTTKMVNVQ
jgi:hypothetical protein